MTTFRDSENNTEHMISMLILKCDTLCDHFIQNNMSSTTYFILYSQDFPSMYEDTVPINEGGIESLGVFYVLMGFNRTAGEDKCM